MQRIRCEGQINKASASEATEKDESNQVGGPKE